MESKFRTITVKGITFECTKHNEESYVSVASISNELKTDSSLFRNIIRRHEPYNSLCQIFEQRDSKNRLQPQVCVPLSLISGLFERAKSSKTVKNTPELAEKLDFMMTLFTLLNQKLIAEYVEMSQDLSAIMNAQHVQREVFSARATLAHKMRESKKLISDYYTKYQHRLNGQLQIDE